MDFQAPVSTANSPANSEPQSAPTGLINKLKKLSKKQKIIAVAMLLLVFGIFAWFMMRSVSTSDTIATVGSTKLPKSYLDLELSYYPATPTAEIEKALVDKVINDQITLEEGKKDGYITDFPNGATLSKEDYLKRTQLVEEVKQKINSSGNMVTGKLISVWFYNNIYVGPKGFEESKRIAYAKIKPLYDQVQNGSITVEQAGEQIAGDASLIEIDKAYKGNALVDFTFYKGGTGTFWPEFNDIIWETEEGQITPLYLGAGAMRDGKPSEELYIFARIDKKSTNPDFNDYKEWIEKKKSASTVVISDSTSFKKPSFIKEAFAQDNTMQSGVWSGFVKTETGAGIAGADAYITTSCTGPAGKHMTTNGSGYFNTGYDTNLACVCTPHTITANVPNMVCDKFTYQSVGNPVADIPQDITCRVPPPPPTPTPTPTPTPPPACNVSCTTDVYCQGASDGCTSCVNNSCQHVPVCGETCTTPADCQNARDGCTQCLPNPSGTGNICQPPPPPACGAFCSTNAECTRNTEGCTQCVAGQCRIPPACNVACTKPEQCAQAKDGCTDCLPADSGVGSVCRPPAACNVACTRDDQCAGATRDGCTMCIDNVCKKPPACNDSCAKASDCARAADGCTSCLPGDAGTGNVCRPTPACNVACTKDGQCAGAKDGCIVCMKGVCKPPPSCGTACTDRADCANPKDGCSECLEGTCTDYNKNMCKCDGIVADLTYPSNAFKFEAFGKVEGTDTKKAEIADITFRMTKDNQVIAKSNPITPEIVESSTTKTRFKAAWQTTPPAVDKNSTYQVFADVRCKPKKIVASNGELAQAEQATSESVKQLPPPRGLQLIADVVNKLFGKGSDLITKEALAQFSITSPVPTQAGSNLQLKTLNFIKMLSTDNCRFVMWKFDETLF